MSGQRDRPPKERFRLVDQRADTRLQPEFKKPEGAEHGRGHNNGYYVVRIDLAVRCRLRDCLVGVSCVEEPGPRLGRCGDRVTQSIGRWERRRSRMPTIRPTRDRKTRNRAENRPELQPRRIRSAMFGK